MKNIDRFVVPLLCLCILVEPCLSAGCKVVKKPEAPEKESVSDRWTKGQGKACGHSPNVQRIVEGEEAPLNAWPWHVNIQTLNRKGLYSFCGAVLISDRWVLTAAHCLMDMDHAFIHLGVISLNTKRHTVKALQVQDSPRLYVHPRYDPKSKYNDIALIKLRKSVKMDRNINTACLPRPGQDFKDATCYVTGLGRTDHKLIHTKPVQKLKHLKVVPGEYHNCVDKFIRALPQRYPNVSQDVFTSVEKTMHEGRGAMCVESNQDGRWRLGRPCKGDSGGPLSCLVGSQYYVAGVSSFGPYGCLRGMPNFYTNITYYLSWINLVTRMN